MRAAAGPCVCRAWKAMCSTRHARTGAAPPTLPITAAGASAARASAWPVRATPSSQRAKRSCESVPPSVRIAVANGTASPGATRGIAETAAARRASAAGQSRPRVGFRRPLCLRRWWPPLLLPRTQAWMRSCSLPDATDGASPGATKTRRLSASPQSARRARSVKAGVLRLLNTPSEWGVVCAPCQLVRMCRITVHSSSGLGTSNNIKLCVNVGAGRSAQGAALSAPHSSHESALPVQASHPSALHPRHDPQHQAPSPAVPANADTHG